MPTTRSMKTDRVTHDQPPASPSVEVTSQDPVIISREMTQDSTIQLTSSFPVTTMSPAGGTALGAAPASRPGSVRSHRSNTIAKIREAELRAECELARITKKQLELEASLIKKQLAYEVAAIEESDQDSLCADQPNVENERTSEWIEKHALAGERAPHTNKDVAPHLDSAPFREKERRTTERVRVESPPRENRERRRTRSPTPSRSKDRGIDRLAEALEQMVRSRPPPRQAQELPTFSGAITEWLPFKAAMRDSTQICKFSRSENLSRLRNCLKGEAKEAVNALLYSASDPEIIMRTLEQRFGRPEVIIDNTLNEIKRLPRPGPTAGELNMFAVRLQNLVCVLSTVDERGYINNPMLAREVTEKLSPHLRARWCDFAESNSGTREPEIVSLAQFLMREADRALRYAYTSSPQTKETPVRREVVARPRRPEPKPRAAGIYAITEEEQASVRKCLCCEGNHDVPQCKKYIAMPVADRWDWAKENKVCFKCVNKQHRRFACKAKKCGVNACTLNHHPTLHEDRPLAHNRTETAPKGDEQTAVMATAACDDSRRSAVLLKVCPVTVVGPRGRPVSTFALLDEGSTVSLIDEKLAQRIGADGPVHALSIHGVTSSARAPDSKKISIRIRGKRQTDDTEICLRTMRNFSVGCQTVATDCLQYAHLRELKADDVCYEMARPQLLIGADNWHLIVSRQLLTGKLNEPIASLTRLGWIIHGIGPSIITNDRNDVLTTHSPHVARCAHVRLDRDDELHDMVRSHFAIDALGITSATKLSQADSRAVEVFNKTVRQVNGRFEVGLPWQSDDVCMPESFDMALRRLKAIERKMDKSPDFRQAYVAQMDNLISKGYAVKCKESETEHPRKWWLPHFAVTNPNKPGKIRLVFDAAARSNNVCLNDALLDGPDLLQSLPGILFRFRERPIAIAADIREMFLQIKIREQDQPAQMFLWRNGNGRRQPDAYKMASMIFGARSSPFLAHSVRDRNAELHRSDYPRAHYAITKSHYMDDLVDSYASVEEAREVVSEVRKVHERGGFTIGSWNCNKEDVLRDVPPELKADTSGRSLGENVHAYEKTLGLRWHASVDQLGFNTSLVRVHEDVRCLRRAPTKREALSAVMSIFDPLGLLSYFTVRAKIYLQQLWRLKIGWDEAIPSDLAKSFETWLGTLHRISELRLDRCYYNTGGESADIQLHVFGDASAEAYAAVAYWRINHAGRVRVVLAAAKARVAPLRAQSIPRLELQAALIAARLAALILREHRWAPTKVVYWSDSKTTLQWIRNDSIRYTPYVAHRVTEVTELTSPLQWRWVPTELNVADDATRAEDGIKSSDDRWFVGPGFLYEPENEWPQEQPTEAVGEEHVAHIRTASDESLPDIDRFSDYERLIRATAYVLLFADASRKRARTLELRHVEEAERRWLRQSQIESFPTEIESLRRGLPVSKTSKIYLLDPALDKDGILRVRGRINAARVAESVKNPIMLDGRHKFTRLLVSKEHKKAGHANNERVVNDLRQTYWITKLRPTVRSTASACQLCKVRKATPRIPLLGDLPIERLEPYTRPFTHTGVDYFGPMIVTVGRRHEKRWGALFTCLTTRAVHIELASTLSTDSAIMALRRMAARRGWPRTIYSDNATNFKGAEKELKEAYRQWLPALKDFALTQRTDWKYIAPGAPNQGGAWERLVRSIKTALTAVLTAKYPREEVLRTVLTEAEYSVNGRPLTHVPVTMDDPEALTPNHFLVGSSNCMPTGPCEHASKQSWKASQAIANEFWKRWLKEYLPTLAPRGGSTQGAERLVAKGDLVVVVDQNLPRNVWPRGVIEAVYPGPDGRVRNVDVRTKGGVFRRPVRKLAVLRVDKAA